MQWYKFPKLLLIVLSFLDIETNKKSKMKCENKTYPKNIISEIIVTF